MSENIITVKNLVKRYKKTKERAVDDISFDVKKGEFFAFLGPNGAGKTTTISILTTTLAKTKGQVEVAGYDLEKNASKVRENIGVIFQNPSLDENLTAEENIRFHAVLYGLFNFRPTYALMNEKYKKRVKELSEVIGLEDKMFSPVKSFSGGMKRKLEIIRSLMHKPKVLYLDEPTSGLDPASRKNLWKYLSQVRETEETTMFLTTHYLEEAEDADRVAILNKGKLVTLGTPRKIKNELIEEYLLIDAKNKKVLEKELKKMKVKYETKKKYIKVETNGKKPAEIVQKIKTKLTFLDVHSPSLEEAYLKIIDNEQN